MLKAISVLGRTIFIKPLTDAQQLDHVKEHKDETLYGLYSEEDSTIYMKDGLERTFYQRILLHEITHAILNISGLRQFIDNNVEEALCEVMENFQDVLQSETLRDELDLV